MASISTSKSGLRKIQFASGDGQRKIVRLGKASKRDADAILAKIEAILESKLSRRSLAPEVASWLGEIPDVLSKRLAAVGLIAPRSDHDKPDCGELRGSFLTDHLIRRTDLKGTSMVVYEQVQRNLEAFFGKEKPLREITEGNAVDFGRYLASGKANRGQPDKKLSRTTVDRRMSLATTIFNDAVRLG